MVLVGEHRRRVAGATEEVGIPGTTPVSAEVKSEGQREAYLKLSHEEIQQRIANERRQIELLELQTKQATAHNADNEILINLEDEMNNHLQELDLLNEVSRDLELSDGN